MSTRTCVARALCVVLTTAAGTGLRPAHAVEVAGSRPAEPKRGFLVDRLSRSDLRIWRAIEEVIAASDASGAPRSPTLRRLWEWARTSTDTLHVELVAPSKLAAGIVGVFRVERFDPTGQDHVIVIRLSPERIRSANANSGPNAVLSFDRFEGLTDVERYAEVLAHELAHAFYVLDSPDRLAELQGAERAIEEFLYRAGRGTGPPHKEIAHWCASSLAVLAASEAHAESVEAAVLRELAATRRVATDREDSPAERRARWTDETSDRRNEAAERDKPLYSAPPTGPAIEEDVYLPGREARGAGVDRWRSKLALDLVPTRSWDGSAREAWVTSTAPVTPAWSAK
jgi:hypothetical protein